MLKRNVTVIVVLALGFVLGYGTLAFTQDKDKKQQQGAHLLRPIHAAARSLEQAENHLQKAEHHFGGHRAKALDLVKQAEGELKQAVEYAKANAPAAKSGTTSAPAPATTPPATTTPAPATPAPATPAPKQ